MLLSCFYLATSRNSRFFFSLFESGFFAVRLRRENDCSGDRDIFRVTRALFEEARDSESTLLLMVFLDSELLDVDIEMAGEVRLLPLPGYRGVADTLELRERALRLTKGRSSSDELDEERAGDGVFLGRSTVSGMAFVLIVGTGLGDALLVRARPLTCNPEESRRGESMCESTKLRAIRRAFSMWRTWTNVVASSHCCETR